MKLLKNIHIAGAIFTLILGTLLHFVWEWSNQSNLTAIFSAVNESTWEHLKLLFFPFIIFSIIEYFLYGKDKSCFFTIKLQAVLLGMFIIISVFYTYTGIIGTNYFILDISTFIIGVIGSYYYSYQKLNNSSFHCSSYIEFFSLFMLIVLLFAFGFFSFYPPTLGLFHSPI